MSQHFSMLDKGLFFLLWIWIRALWLLNRLVSRNEKRELSEPCAFQLLKEVTLGQREVKSTWILIVKEASILLLMPLNDVWNPLPFHDLYLQLKLAVLAKRLVMLLRCTSICAQWFSDYLNTNLWANFGVLFDRAWIQLLDVKLSDRIRDEGSIEAKPAYRSLLEVSFMHDSHENVSFQNHFRDLELNDFRCDQSFWLDHDWLSWCHKITLDDFKLFLHVVRQPSLLCFEASCISVVSLFRRWVQEVLLHSKTFSKLIFKLILSFLFSVLCWSNSFHRFECGDFISLAFVLLDVGVWLPREDQLWTLLHLHYLKVGLARFTVDVGNSMNFYSLEDPPMWRNDLSSVDIFKVLHIP